MRSLFALGTLFSLVACGGSNSASGPTAAAAGGSSWLIPANQVVDGGPGKDGIPALTNPTLIAASSASYLSASDLVIGVKIGDEIRAYPHRVLDWHEVVNDTYGGLSRVISYCPLTGSALLWDGLNEQVNPTFGVSGLLYNSNLILYDRATDSRWSQMLIQAVNGSLAGTRPATLPVVETTWATWRAMYPATRVLSNQTGFSRDYSVYPYGTYRTDNNLLFAVDNSSDSRLPRKERVLGVRLASVNKAYAIRALGRGVNVIEEADGDYVVVGSQDLDFAVAYSATAADGKRLSFRAIPDALPVVLEDAEGSRWDVFGRAVSGPRAGERLERVNSFVAYWFAWTAFYPNATIHS